MKISILLYNFQNGGAQNILIKTANLLANNGLDVVMFVIDNSGPLSFKLNKKIQLVELKSSSIRKSFLPLAIQLKKQKPNFVITTLLAPSILLILCNLFILTPSKILIREASTPSLEPKKSFKVKLLYGFGRIILPLADKIIAVSEGVKEDLMTYYKLKESKIEVIYNPVFSQKYFSSPKPKEKSDQINILFLGRIAPVKRIEIQLRAIAILVKEKYNMQFNIVGNIADFGYAAHLKSLATELKIENNVIWHDYVQDVDSMYFKNDILLLTSLYEGLPSVLIEALLHNLKVIACDCPNGPREILDSGQLGTLIPYDNCNPKIIADKIIDTENIKINYKKIQKYLKKFSEESVTKNYKRLFTELID